MKNKIPRIIWIDDMRNPETIIGNTQYWIKYLPNDFLNICNEKPEIIWLKSYNEWLTWLVKWHNESNEYVNCFCLDHDIASFDKDGKEYTGENVAYDIVNEILENDKDFPYYECHSSNPVGRENIISVFNSCKKILDKIK